MDREMILEQMKKRSIINGMTVGAELRNSKGNYLGIGISGRRELTEELPFDAMGMILTAELLKREFGLERSVIIVADRHAKTNGFDSAAIDRIAKNRRELLENTLQNLGLERFDVVLGSETFQGPLYQRMNSQQRVNAGYFIGNSYESEQLNDMALQGRTGENIKIGWSRDSMTMDERHFDDIYRTWVGDDTTFVYVEHGRALDGTPMPPYLNNRNLPRLFLKADEDIGKVGDAPRKVRNYFTRIVDLFDEVTGHATSSKSIEDRLKEVYGITFSGRYI